MDNPQVTDDVRAAWLAALIDGEGSLAMYAQHARTRSLLTHINVANSDPRLIATAAAILKSWNIGCYISRQKTPGLDSWRLDVRGYKRCLPLLLRLDPWFVSKKAEADIMRRLIEYRLSLPPKAPYGDTEATLVRVFKDVKHTRHLTDFVPSSVYCTDEDKVESNPERDGDR
jgi:hypothetical protein